MCTLQNRGINMQLKIVFNSNLNESNNHCRLLNSTQLNSTTVIHSITRVKHCISQCQSTDTDQTHVQTVRVTGQWHNHRVWQVTCYRTQYSLVHLNTTQPRPTLLKLLRKISGRFLIVGQCLTISEKALTRHNFALLTSSRFNNNVT